jgi:5-methylcytosine-specific restriction enzyme B
MDLKEFIQRFLQYSKTNKLSLKSFPEKEYNGFKLRVSFGLGKPSNTPFIAFLSNRNKPRAGIYPLIQYHKGIELITLVFGVSEYLPPHTDWNLESDNYETLQDLFNRERFGYARFPKCKVFASYKCSSLNLDELVEDVSRILDIYSRQK